jgi:hypothetical protein
MALPVIKLHSRGNTNHDWWIISEGETQLLVTRYVTVLSDE